MKKSILFLIPTLGQGGAEKVLVNLVNHLNTEQYDVSVMSLYDEGINRQFLKPTVKYKFCMRKSFHGIAHFMKLLSPSKLYSLFIKEHYDIVVSFLEGQTARIASGCKEQSTKKYCWIHRTYISKKDIAWMFRSFDEANYCYNNFDKLVFVSSDVKKYFQGIVDLKTDGLVLYNVNETEQIMRLSEEKVDIEINENEVSICAMGSLIPVKGFDRLIRCHKKLLENNVPVHTYILGTGKEKQKLAELSKILSVEDTVSFLGYQKNPYKFLKKFDLFVCSSYSEGLSTAVTEALILGIPVVATRVSGMEELLGENSEYGLIVDNNEDSLFEGIYSMIKNNKIEFYSQKSKERGASFCTNTTVAAVEAFFEEEC